MTNEASESRRRSLGRRWWRLGFVLLMAVPATQCLREDELECEEAVKRLMDCCPGFDVNAVQCTYVDVCGVSYPDLTPSESVCILDSSCSELVSNKVCERVPARSSDAGDPERPSGLGGTVCP